MRIALDAMGGDYGPKNTVEGAVLALKEYPYIKKLFLVGDAVAIGKELKRLDFKDARIEVFHASDVVSMKEEAAKAVATRRTRRYVVQPISSKMDRLKRSFPLDTPGQPWWLAFLNCGC
jgi:glycerol-3-phosphate acyltransferase PlsX